jgi:UDPglucose 6-dehydrogenase
MEEETEETKKLPLMGIIGQGFVGNAVKEGIKHAFNVETYDIIKEKSTQPSVSALLSTINCTFLCVPTPMKKSGECDLSIVESVLQEINEWGLNKPDDIPMVILKSTVPVGTCEMLQAKYDHLVLVFNPEFLTEANAVDDFKNQQHIIFGFSNYVAHADNEYSHRIVSFIRGLCYDIFAGKKISVSLNTYSEAEMVKYVSNCFLAVKVSFANQIFELCNATGVTYDNILFNLEQDGRLGRTHWKVPGPDGDRGYGGHCFPKDMAAIAFEGDKLGVNLSLIKEAIAYNNSIRIGRNWENMIGRAVSND